MQYYNLKFKICFLPHRMWSSLINSGLAGLEHWPLIMTQGAQFFLTLSLILKISLNLGSF